MTAPVIRRLGWRESHGIQKSQWYIRGTDIRIPDPRLWTHIEDDVAALAFYGSFGLADPKMPFEAVAIKRSLGLVGLTGLMIGAGISMSAGIATAALIGWTIDPMDKREGGLAETTWYQKVSSRVHSVFWEQPRSNWD